MSINDSSTRTIQLVAGFGTTSFDGVNTFKLQLPASGFRTGKDEVALKSMSLFYSWPNVSAMLGNNSFSYTWGGTSYPVVMADGMWQFADILDYLQQVMVKNGHYLKDQNGLNVYYINFIVNPVLYCLSLTVTPVPSSLPAGWTNPAALPLTGLTPQLTFPQSMSKLTGFPAASYPAAPQASVFQVNSGIPQISGVTSLNVVSTIVNSSGLSLYPNTLTSFTVPSDQRAGTLIQLQPSNLDWVPVRQDNFTEIEVSIVDQLYRPVQIRDPAGFVLIMNVRKRA